MEHRFETDEEGFILDFEKGQNPAWVKKVMDEQGLAFLTDQHEEILTIIRDYYRKYKMAPMIRILCKISGIKLKHIYELFPHGPGKGACRMAGVPRPTGCV